MDAPRNETRPSNRWLTVPNLLCVIRLIGSFVLVALAWLGFEMVFLATFLFLTFTDWIDGKLARWLDQRSEIGPWLDSLADVALYAALAFGVFWLRGDEMLREWPWLAAAVFSYAASCAVALLKFRRLPSYHTRIAKTAWLLVGIATIALLLDWSVWPLRIAAAVVTIGNIECVMLTLVLREWATDVPSIFSHGRNPALPQKGV